MKILTRVKIRQPPDLTKFKGFVESKIPGDIEFNIPHVTCSFIQNQLQNLKVSIATGIDELSARYLKLSASVISEPLTKILNLSIDKGTFPNDLKTAKYPRYSKKGKQNILTSITTDPYLCPRSSQ